MAEQTPRIACVQYGDYAEALRAMTAGEPETYQGQFATVEAFERFIADGQSLVISLATQRSRVDRPDGRGSMLALDRRGRVRMPRRIRERLLGMRVLHELTAFRPTHLVCRVTGIVGNAVLAWAIRNRVPSVVIVATTLDATSEADRRFCAQANDPLVAFAANHLRVATQSLVGCGLRADKAVEYDQPGRASPEAFPAKRLDGIAPSLLYVGVLSEPKGAGDFLDAVRLLRARGRTWPATVCGDGPLADRFRAAAADPSLGLSYLGQTPRDRVEQLVRETAVSVVPSRPTFAEGLPLALIEALATRTPVVASAHPVFTNYFDDGIGVRFFPPGNAAALADAAERLLTDADLYAATSEATAQAWHGAQTDLLFPDLLTRLEREWQLNG